MQHTHDLPPALEQMKGLGPKSAAQLKQVGITTPQELKALGAIKAFMRLREKGATKPSLNFLYAMVGALEDKQWLHIARAEKGRLLIELEGYEELLQILKSDE